MASTMVEFGEVMADIERVHSGRSEILKKTLNSVSEIFNNISNSQQVEGDDANTAEDEDDFFNDQSLTPEDNDKDNAAEQHDNNETLNEEAANEKATIDEALTLANEEAANKKDTIDEVVTPANEKPTIDEAFSTPTTEKIFRKKTKLLRKKLKRKLKSMNLKILFQN
ncbi:hypothetical protein PTKIN_Ptkin02bG0118200 [Pterospermum kingtungense]